MCGIAGFVSLPGRFSGDELRTQAEAACAALAHRGPDDQGTWVDAEAGLAFAFRRLAIIDLSQEGHQPMHSADGRYVMVFNGEVYNYVELRSALEANRLRFRGHSDTEVFLEACSHWGLREALERSNGMFALALWDRQERVLHLARDRLGQKPLYYGRLNGAFAFASELSALKAHPDFRPELDRDALTLYLRYGMVPAPYTIFRGLSKLTPGTSLTLEARRAEDGSGSSPFAGELPEPEPYWSVTETAQQGLANPIHGSEQETLAELDSLLRDAVRLCMVSDVPLGAFLSGGIDSSTVVALMQAQSNRPVKTYSIGFHEEGYNEATHAASVAAHLGTDHTELYVTPQETQAVVPKLPQVYDEPFADSSQIPTFLVSELARQSVTVSLSGDGGDELFGGYNRYIWARNLERAFAVAPRPLRQLGAAAARAIPVELWDSTYKLLSPLLPSRHRYSLPGDKIHKLATVIAAAGREEMYQRLTSLWQQPDRVVIGGREPPTLIGQPDWWPRLGTFTDQMFLLDSRCYLPDDILVKLDRASMSVSLEGRVPLLDHRVAEFSWRVPLELKIRNGGGKWLLRRLLAQYVPQHLIERPKMGFGVPIGTWLRGDLRDWAETLLAEPRLAAAGIFDPAPIRRIWADHLSGRRNWQYQLWTVLMFEAWREAQQ